MRHQGTTICLAELNQSQLDALHDEVRRGIASADAELAKCRGSEERSLFHRISSEQRHKLAQLDRELARRKAAQTTEPQTAGE